MKSLEFKEANFTFAKPYSMTDEECSDLRVFKGKYPDGTPVIISKWQPSKEDIEAINRGEGIYLSIIGIVVSFLLCFGAIFHLKNTYPGIELTTENIKP